MEEVPGSPDTEPQDVAGGPTTIEVATVTTIEVATPADLKAALLAPTTAPGTTIRLTSPTRKNKITRPPPIYWGVNDAKN